MNARVEQLVGFALLCLISGSTWMVRAYTRGPLTGLLRAAVHSAALCLLFALAAAHRQRGAQSVPVGTYLSVAVWSAVLLALPPVIFAGADGRVSDFTEVLVLAFVPAVTVFVVAQTTTGFGAEAGSLGLLLPALVGLAGAALLLPFTLPSSFAGRLWLAASVVAAILAGVAGVRLHAALRSVKLLSASGVICGASAIFTAAFLRLNGARSTDRVELHVRAVLAEAAICLLFDGPALLLIVWLLREMKPVSFASRYLLIPLVTVLEGAILLRPRTTWTLAAGSLLLAAGGGWLLLKDREGEPA